MGSCQSAQSLARVVGSLCAGILFDLSGENLPYYAAAGFTVWALWRNYRAFASEPERPLCAL